MVGGPRRFRGNGFGFVDHRPYRRIGREVVQLIPIATGSENVFTITVAACQRELARYRLVSLKERVPALPSETLWMISDETSRPHRFWTNRTQNVWPLLAAPGIK